MNGVDVITFAGGIGENAIDVRKQICESLSFLGVKVDEDRNNGRGKEVEISTSNSKVKVFVNKILKGFEKKPFFLLV